MIKELDPAVLTESLPGEALEPGDVGWVVMVHAGGVGFEVEFVTLTGKTVTVVTVPASAVRPVLPREIPHARGAAKQAGPPPTSVPHRTTYSDPDFPPC